LTFDPDPASMDSEAIVARRLSLTLQYVGIRFRWFMYSLQKSSDHAILEKMNWYGHVQEEVVCSSVLKL